PGSHRRGTGRALLPRRRWPAGLRAPRERAPPGAGGRGPGQAGDGPPRGRAQRRPRSRPHRGAPRRGGRPGALSNDHRPPALDNGAALAVAHALRTPVTALALGLGLLEDGVLGALNEGQREVVHTLVGEVARLMHLLERDLDIEHLGAYTGPAQPVERLRV